MKDDKNLKELLMKWAVADTSENFTQQVMQRIESGYAARPATTPFLRHRLMKVLAVVFAAVCIILLVLCIIAKPAKLPVNFTIKVSPKYYSQAFYFLIAFWMVMFINQYINKSKAQPF